MTFIHNKNRKFLSLLTATLLWIAGLNTVSAIDLRLVETVKNQDWEMARDLLNDSAIDINASQPDGTTALMWAAHWGSTEAAEKLIHAGADPDLGNDYGVTPLHLAAKNRDVAMVDILLKGGADPNITLWNGVTPLMSAARTGVVDIVNLLLEYGADINVQEPRRKQDALMWAISSNHVDAARVLIEHGADVNTKTIRLNEDFKPMVLKGYGTNVKTIAQGGYTPLMFAARQGNLNSTRLLLANGAEINQVSEEDGSALVIASSSGYEELALFLLERGADPDIADINGMTPLHYAMRDGLKILHSYSIESAPDTILPGKNMHELAKSLMAHGADPNAAMNYSPPHLRLANLIWFNLNGATPLFLATAALDLTAINMLLESGADPLVKTIINKEEFDLQKKLNADDNQIAGNATPLMVAAGLGRRKYTAEEESAALTAAKKLVGLGARVNDTTATGWTALHAATLIGADSLVEFLVKNGAMINAQNGCGQTPMSLAIGDNVKGLLYRTEPKVNTAELLIDLGAIDMPISDSVGECVLGRGGLEADTEHNLNIEKKNPGNKEETGI